MVALECSARVFSFWSARLFVFNCIFVIAKQGIHSTKLAFLASKVIACQFCVDIAFDCRYLGENVAGNDGEQQGERKKYLTCHN